MAPHGHFQSASMASTVQAWILSSPPQTSQRPKISIVTSSFVIKVLLLLLSFVSPTSIYEFYKKATPRVECNSRPHNARFTTLSPYSYIHSYLERYFFPFIFSGKRSSFVYFSYPFPYSSSSMSLVGALRIFNGTGRFPYVLTSLTARK